MKNSTSKTNPSTPELINIHLLPANERTAARLRIYAAFKDGIPAADAAAKLHYRTQTVRTLYARFETEGESAVHEKPHGFALLNKSAFTPEERDALADAVFLSDPREWTPGFSLWSVKAVVAFAKARFGRDISTANALGALHRMGFSKTAPIRCNRKAVRDWTAENYPLVRSFAAARGALVFWTGETFAPPMPAKVPSLESALESSSPTAPLKCFSARCNRGDTYFRNFEGPLETEWVKSFFLGLVADVGQPVLAILEERRLFRTVEMQDWFRSMREEKKLWTRFLPVTWHPLPFLKS